MSLGGIASHSRASPKCFEALLGVMGSINLFLGRFTAMSPFSWNDES